MADEFTIASKAKLDSTIWEHECYRAALERIARGDVPGVGDWADCVQAFARSTLEGAFPWGAE